MPLRCALLLPLLFQGDGELPLDRELELRVAPDAPSTLQVRVDGPGTLHLWATSQEADPRLALHAEDGAALGSDDDSGGWTSAYLRVELEGAGTQRLTVEAGDAPADGASVLLHATLRSKDDLDTELLSEILARIAEGQSVTAGDPEAAREVFASALELVLSVPAVARGDRIADAATQLGLLARMAGDPETAVVAFETASEALSALLPPTHPTWLHTRADYAVTLGDVGRIEEALTIQEEVVAIEQLILDPDDSTLLRARNGLAVSLRELGRFEEALDHQLEMLEVVERSRSPDHPEFLAAQMNLATTYVELGELLTARWFLEQVVAGVERTQPPDSLDLALVRSNLAVTLFHLGDADGALMLQEEVVESLANQLPPEHPTVLQTLNVLASFYMMAGDVERACDLHEELTGIYESKVGPDHRWTLDARENRAAALRELGRFEEAVVETRALLEAWERLQPGKTRLALVRIGHASSLLGVGETAAACEELERVLREETLPEGSRLGMSARGELVLASLAEDDPARAREAAWALSNGLALYFRRASIASAPREAEAATSLAMTYLDAILCLWKDEPLIEPERALELVESARGLGLVAHRLARRAADSSSELARMRASIDDAAAEVNALALSGADPGEFSSAVVRLETAERSLRDAIGSRELAPPEISTARVAAALGADEAAVSFWRHETRVPGHEDAPRWLALVLRPDGSVRRIDLGPARELQEAIAAWRATLAPRAGRLRGRPVGEAPSLRARAGSDLRKRLVDPWRAALGDARRVHLVPFGAMNRIPIDALPLDEDGGRRVGDELLMTTLDSLGELMVRSEESPGRDGLVAFGGIEYAPDARADFTPLPATSDEVAQLAELHAGAFPDAPRTVLTGPQATAGAFSARAPSARWLHVATHGWFAPSSVPSVTRQRFAAPVPGLAQVVDLRENVRGLAPSLLCGLAFAGSGGTSQDGARPAGVLTGADLARLDLEACELAVLSACESAVGEFRAGRGLASLRRSLHAGGVRNVVSSLWKVPDEPTRELMVELYRRIWMEREPAAKALWEAKRMLRDRGRPPSDWAGWILSGPGR